MGEWNRRRRERASEMKTDTDKMNEQMSQRNGREKAGRRRGGEEGWDTRTRTAKSKT